MWKMCVGIVSGLLMLGGITTAVNSSRQPEREKLRNLSDACSRYSATIGISITDAQWELEYDKVRTAVYAIPAMDRLYPEVYKKVDWLSRLPRVREPVQAACKEVQTEVAYAISGTYLGSSKRGVGTRLASAAAIR